MPERDPVKPPKQTRYRYVDVVVEIERYLDRRGRGAAKEAAKLLGMTESQFSKRLRGVHARFSIEQLGALALWADHSPPGWPLVPWHAASSAAPSAVNGD